MQFKKLVSWIVAISIAFTIIGFTFARTPEIASQVPNIGVNYQAIGDANNQSQDTSAGSGTGITSQNSVDVLWMGAEFLIGIIGNIILMAGVLAIPIIVLPTIFHFPLVWASGIQIMLTIVETWTYIQIKAKMGTKVIE